MSVKIIDTLKPKNDGSFPIVEAVDVAVSDELRLPEALEAKANASALADAVAVIEGKANTSDVNTSVANLQGQIDQIEISASAEDIVAPEVAAARVGSDSTSYTTLKQRLDSDSEKASQFRGELSDLNYLEIKQATAIGVYNARSTTTESLTDKPAGVTGPFSLIVGKWGTGDALGTSQLLISSIGETFQRFIAPSGNIVIDWASGLDSVRRSINSASQFRGEIADLGYTAISQATSIGCYSSLTSTTEMLEDKPEGISGPFTLIINKWLADGNPNGTVQILISASGELWQRFLGVYGNVVIDWKSSTTDIKKNAKRIETLYSVNFENEEIPVTMTRGKFWDISSGEVAVLTDIVESSWSASPEIAVSAGEIYRIISIQGNSHKARIWTLCDDEMNIISMCDDIYGFVLTEQEFEVPEGATKLVITHKIESEAGQPRLGKKQSKINSAIEKVEKLSAGIFSDYPKAVAFIQEGLSISGSTTNYTNRVRTGIVATPSDTLSIYTAIGYKFRAAYYTTSEAINSSTVPSSFDHFSPWYEGSDSSVVLESGYYVRLLAGYESDADVSDVSDFTENVRVYLQRNRIDVLEEIDYPLSGLKLSLLGDSISAYAGTIPDGNEAYYRGNNSGVSSSSQMWWSVLCEDTGMTPLVINAWSGSAITQLEDSSHISKIPMSDDTRCSNLGTDNNDPDVIIIAGGVNDYTYAQSAQSEPLEWDPHTAATEGNSFTETYAAMIKKLQQNYPNAVIIALSTWFTMRGTDNGYTLTHSVGSNVYTQQDYNDKIKFVADQMHIPYVDVSVLGFNRNNFYPTYAQDSSSIPTHPNAAGQKAMGMYLASIIPSIVRGFKS